MEPFRILEWAATFVESIVILSTIAAASQKRQQDLRHYCLLVLSAVSLTVLTGFMNAKGLPHIFVQYLLCGQRILDIGRFILQGIFDFPADIEVIINNQYLLFHCGTSHGICHW